MSRFGHAKLGILLLAALFPAQGEDLPSFWNDMGLRAIRAANVPPPMAVRQLAVVHIAMFDAVAAKSGLSPIWLEEKSTNAVLLDAAVSEAAYQTLRVLFPKSAEMFDSHRRAILATLSGQSDAAEGLKWGAFAARATLRKRQFDKSGETVAFPLSQNPGYWNRTLPFLEKPLLPNWGRMLPFALPNTESFRPLPPPPLNSSEWAAEYNLVKRIGATNSAARTLEQREIALFWADGPNTETPPGHWNRIAQQVVQKNRYSLAESARLFAALNIAMADAAIVCWDAKYHYKWWRPITAIRAGATDNNPATDPDLSWTPLIPTPPFPEHTSGHSSFSGAAATTLAKFTGSDEFAFVTRSDGLPGVVRRFRRFSDAASEAGMSRLYGGIHFPSANEEGLKCGKKVGDYIARWFLDPDNVRN